MMIRSPVLRAATLLHSRVTYNYFFKGLHDPSKHIVMNHFPHNVYIDYWPFGQYPQTYTIGSVASAAYQSQAQKILAEALKSNYSIDLTGQHLLDVNLNKFFKKHGKDTEASKQFFDSVLKRLATGIFVKQSRWTWIKEQQVRLSVTAGLLKQSQPQTVRQFLQAYNQAIEKLVLVSNFGYSNKIEHEETAQQKHFYRELNTNVEGIQDLKDQDKPENNNLINKIMRVIHSV